MSLIDLILNLAGLMLWLRWRARSRSRASSGTPGRLASTLQRTEPGGGGWLSLAALVGLLVVRGFFYRQIGAEVDWTPSIPVGPVVLTFRSDLPARIFVFSLLSFAASLGILYASLLLLSMVNHSVAEGNLNQRWVRARLGWIERWPWGVKLFLPWFALSASWLLLSPVLVRLGVIPRPNAAGLLLEQAAVIGLGSYLSWKFVIAGVLVLHIVSSYVYLGNAPFWNFLNPAARTLVKPVSFLPLQLGRFDFAPVIVMVLVFALSETAVRGLSLLYARLPLF